MSDDLTTSLQGVVAVAAIARSESELLGLLARRAGLQAAVNNPVCNNRAKSCSSDCSGLIQCAYMTDVWQVVSTSKCPDRTPYCDPGDGTTPASCTATPPTGDTCNPATPQPLPAGAYNCSADGYWPDLTSCTKYYLCVGNNAYQLDCSAFPNTVYDQRTAHCVPKNRAGVSCYTLRCTDPNPNQPIQYQIYDPAPWIYAVCTSRDATKALVGRCADERTTISSNGTCVQNCIQEGRFKPLNGNTADTTAYVDCVDLGNNKLSPPTPGTCPTGTTFNADDGVGECVVSPATP